MSSRIASPMPGKPLTEDDGKANAAFAQVNTEMQAIFNEGMGLERLGRLDESATKRIEARLDEISVKLDKEVADRIAASKASHPLPTRFVLPRRYAFMAFAVFIFVAVGAPLELSMGATFIFSGANQYRAAMPWLFAVLLPIFAVVLFFLERANHAFDARFPTWWVRWLLKFPLMVAFSTTLVIVSPLGWAALSGWAIGTTSSNLHVKTVSIGPASPKSRGCDQHAKLEFADSVADICLEGRVSGRTPKPGERLQVIGRVSRLGLYIEEVRTQ